MIAWSEAESYLQVYSLAMILSLVVDSNLLFNHHSGYLVVVFVVVVVCVVYLATGPWGLYES